MHACAAGPGELAGRRLPFIGAAGGRRRKIELERGERPQVVKRVLAEAAKGTGINVRSSWEDSQRVLLWKRTDKERRRSAVLPSSPLAG